MLRNWVTHEEYQKRFIEELALLPETEKSRVVSMDKPLSKLYLLNLDNLLTVIKPLYSNTGSPAKNQQGIIRSLILMLDCNEHSITKWAKKVAVDPLLCAACGFETGQAPSLHQWNMIPYIPLDSRTRMDYKKPHPGISCFDDKGRPICLGGIPYEHIGYSYPKGIKYRCWFDCKGIDKPCKCSDSNYGRTIYIKPDYDFRLFPPVPRSSESFKKKFKTRTSVERSNKRILVDYNVEAGRCRSSKQRFTRAVLAAVNIHLDAWIKHTKFSVIPLLYNSVAV